MVSSLIDEICNQRIANQTIANRLDQAERELAEHRAANTRERSETPLDPLGGTPNPQNTGLFGHDPPKLKLQRIGRNRHLAAKSTKHSDPILERINGKAGGTENTDPAVEPFDPRKSNSSRHEEPPSGGIR
ncbi:hypothetical protein F2Q69_00046398 [Brassica cretica]|uniref:Uncharacterized protein n=1 Tax=Brassica cretica TaxID=69181 RepID=A0A8S9PVX7_BRACR|nr:hypothetical protein F2Q69_00046398 [Brassica cretica]